MSDLLRTLAFAFRRKGADQMAGTELRYLLAFDLRWFAPEDAKKVVLRGLELGLLREEGEAIRPSFDTAAVEIPVNFRPTNLVIDEEMPTNVPAMRAQASAPPAPARPAPSTAPAAPASPQPAEPSAATRAVVATETERASEDERRKRGLLISIEVARLIVRRRDGEDITADAAALEAALLAAAAPTRT